MSCPCCAHHHGYPSTLEGWRYYERRTSRGGDNLFLQHVSGVQAVNMREAREIDQKMKEKDAEKVQ